MGGQNEAVVLVVGDVNFRESRHEGAIQLSCNLVVVYINDAHKTIIPDVKLLYFVVFSIESSQIRRLAQVELANVVVAHMHL